MSLTLYNRNPSAYRELTKNGWLNLPSESLLYLYKYSVRQRPGIISKMMEWMRSEATRLQVVPKEGLYGGIILDEMSIQEDLQIINQGKESTLSGLIDCEPEVILMHNLTQLYKVKDMQITYFGHLILFKLLQLEDLICAAISLS
jgi:hypothetical protein